MSFAESLALLPAGHAWREVVQALAERGPAPLVPSAPWQPKLSQLLLAGDPASLVGGQGGASALSMARAVQSGLLLMNDDLDASHKLSQDLPDSTGSYWHGIMHRREPDYGNARYWFRRVGQHPVMPQWAALLSGQPTPADATAARRALEAAPLDGLAMVGCCEAIHGQAAGPLRAWLEAVQWLEMQTLLTWCWRQAAGQAS
jgi:hypothetical protein